MFPLRDENPAETFPFMTVGLIIINIAVFIYQLSLGTEYSLRQFIYTYSLIPYEITHGVSLFPGIQKIPYLTILTSMFLHGGFIHIIGNMWYLWIFGNNVEDTLGHFKFTLFYLLCGLGGTFGHILSGPNSQIPSLGASGAIAGVLGAYLILFPTARILTLVPLFYFIQIVRLPALLLIGFWFILQLFSGVAAITSPQQGGGIAWFAHIGGFLTGFLLILILPKRPRRRRPNYFFSSTFFS